MSDTITMDKKTAMELLEVMEEMRWHTLGLKTNWTPSGTITQWNRDTNRLYVELKSAIAGSKKYA